MICVIDVIRRFVVRVESCGQSVAKVLIGDPDSACAQELGDDSEFRGRFGSLTAQKRQIVEARELFVDAQRLVEQFQLVGDKPALHLVSAQRKKSARFLRVACLRTHEQWVSLEGQREPLEEINRRHCRDFLANTRNGGWLIWAPVVDQEVLRRNPEGPRQLEKLDDCQVKLPADLDVANDFRCQPAVRDGFSEFTCGAVAAACPQLAYPVSDRASERVFPRFGPIHSFIVSQSSDIVIVDSGAPTRRAR